MTSKSGKITLIIIFAAVIIAFLVSKFLVQIMLVQGQSMEPAIKDKAFVLVNKLDKNYTTDDVIVFKNDNISGVIVKRIVAVSGDEVEITGGCLKVNGTLLNGYTDFLSDMEQIIVSDEYYFVLGDNYNNSIDSRNEEIGLVSKSQIIGKVIGK